MESVKIYSVARMIVLLTIAACMISPQAKAFGEEEEGVREPLIRPAVPEAGSTFRYEAPSGSSAMGGRADITTWESECSEEFKLMGKLPVDLAFAVDYMSINNAFPVELPAKLVGLSVTLGTAVPFFCVPDTYIGCEVYPAFYTDDWSFEAAAFRMPQAYFLAYKPDEHWTLAGGVGVAPRYETNVFPVFSVIYKPTKKITFEISSEHPNITYQLSDNLTCYVEGRYNENEYLVNRDNLKKVKLLYQEILTGGGVEYKFNKYARGAVSAGGVFNRYFKYRDGVGKVDLDDGFYTEVRVTINI